MSENGYQKMSISQRQKKLESMVVCRSGRGQVYIRNFIDPKLRTNGPQLALRCKIREFLGVKNSILGLEEIVLTCCRNPQESCEHYRQFQAKEAAG